MARDKVPVPTDLNTIVADTIAPIALAEAATSEKVQRAMEALLIGAAKEMAYQLVHGNPEQKLKVAALLAGPAIKQVLSPQADQSDTADLQEFHATRRAMTGERDE